MAIMPKKVPDLSPARQALAEAIAAHAEARAEFHAMRDTIEFSGVAGQAVYKARAKLKTAQEDLEKAKAAEADRMTAAAMGRPVEAGLSIRAVRAAIADAEDELQSAEIARQRLRDMIPAAEQRFTWAEFTLRERARDVFRDEFAGRYDEVMARIERLKLELVRAVDAANWLSGTAFPRLNGLYEFQFGTSKFVWDDALAALMADAATSLPAIGLPASK